MANEQNLLRKEDRTAEERRESARKAGIASGVARRRKRTIKENLIQLVQTELSDKEMRKLMKEAGFKDDEMTYGAMMALSTVKGGINGDARLLRLALELLEEAQPQGTVINQLPPTINVNFVGGDKDGH